MNSQLTTGTSNGPEKRLIELLSVLIGWKAGYSDKYIGLVCGPTEEQQEVARLLEEHPELAAPSAIEAAIARARQAEIDEYTLAELLNPPLSVFGALGATDLEELDRGDWRELDDDDIVFKLEELWTPRLGEVVKAWVRDVGDVDVEIIEMWTVSFAGWDRKTEYNPEGYREAECWYRYGTHTSDGQVYRTERAAFAGEGGVSIDVALADGRRHGLVLPDIPFWLESHGQPAQ